MSRQFIIADFCVMHRIYCYKKIKVCHKNKRSPYKMGCCRITLFGKIIVDFEKLLIISHKEDLRK